MNEEIRNNELCEDELENVNGGTGFGILPGFGSTAGERQNEEESADGRTKVKIAINQFGMIKRLRGQH